MDIDNLFTLLCIERKITLSILFTRCSLCRCFLPWRSPMQKKKKKNKQFKTIAISFFLFKRVASKCVSLHSIKEIKRRETKRRNAVFFPVQPNSFFLQLFHYFHEQYNFISTKTRSNKLITSGDQFDNRNIYTLSFASTTVHNTSIDGLHFWVNAIPLNEWWLSPQTCIRKIKVGEKKKSNKMYSNLFMENWALRRANRKSVRNVNQMDGAESVFVVWWNVYLNYWLPLNTMKPTNFALPLLRKASSIGDNKWLAFENELVRSIWMIRKCGETLSLCTTHGSCQWIKIHRHHTSHTHGINVHLHARFDLRGQLIAFQIAADTIQIGR